MAEDGPSDVLGGEVLRSGLSKVERTFDGEGYAFSVLDVSGKNLASLGDELPSFSHVRFLNVSDNQITDLSGVSGMYSVLAVNAANNKVAAIGDISGSTFLQVRSLLLHPRIHPYIAVFQALDVSGNDISEPSEINIPSLTQLNMSGRLCCSHGCLFRRQPRPHTECIAAASRKQAHGSGWTGSANEAPKLASGF